MNLLNLYKKIPENEGHFHTGFFYGLVITVLMVVLFKPSGLGLFSYLFGYIITDQFCYWRWIKNSHNKRLGEQMEY